MEISWRICIWIMGLKGLNQFSSAVLSHSRVSTTIGFSMEFGNLANRFGSLYVSGKLPI